jgi:ABC-type uncharacterized transport system involved in gliding motility auxiliary subunit
MLYSPRSAEAVRPGAEGIGIAADQPRATVLATSTPDGWAEMDPAQTPPRFDEGVDRRGRIGVAVAVERGALRSIDVELSPTRLVVIGDSDFVSNGALKAGAGGNADFFMSAMNWLLEREALMAIAPKNPIDLRLDMNRDQVRTAFVQVVGFLPAIAALLGALVWIRRRR